MIIITENKKQHYLIKNFLKEIEYFTINESLGQDEAGEHTALDISALDFNDTLVDTPKFDIENKEIISNNTPVSVKTLEKASLKKPKMIKLLNLAKKGLIITFIAAASYFGMQGGEKEVSKQIASDNRVPHALVLDQMESQTGTESDTVDNQDNDMTFVYNRDVDADDFLEEIKEEEGFKSLPYPDVKQWSVGYGTIVSKDQKRSKFKKEKGKDLKAEYKALKGNKKKIKAWLSKVYPEWKSDFCEYYNIDENNRDSISKAEGSIASRYSLEEVMNRLKTSAKYNFSNDDSNPDISLYYDYLPVHVKDAMIDMGYNMGTGFTKKFKSFSQAMAVAGMILSSSPLTEEDIEMADIVIKDGAKEVINNYEADGVTIKGPTKYSSDLPERSMKNYNKLISGINPEDYGVDDLNVNFQNENYSIKKAYKNLFS